MRNLGAREIQVIKTGATGLVLLVLGVGCQDGFRLVPQGGQILLRADSTTVEIDGSLLLTACGITSEGFAVASETTIYLKASEGRFGGAVRSPGGSTFDDPDDTEASDSDASVGRCAIEASEGSALLVSETAPVDSDDKLPHNDDEGTGYACVTLCFVPPRRAATVTLGAESGAVKAQDVTVTVVDVPTSLELWSEPTQLGPDGGAASLIADVRGRTGAAVAGASVRFVVANGSLTTGGVATSDADGRAKVDWTTDLGGAVEAKLLGGSAVGDTVVIVPPPRLTRVAPSTAAWVEAEPVELTVFGGSFSPEARVWFAFPGEEERLAEVQPGATAGALAVKPPVPSPLPAEGAPVVAEVRVENPNGLTSGQSGTGSVTFTYEAEEVAETEETDTVGGVQ